MAAIDVAVAVTETSLSLSHSYLALQGRIFELCTDPKTNYWPEDKIRLQ